jgi:hypothetical protein
MGPRSGLVVFGEGKNLLFLPISKSLFLGSPAPSLLTVLYYGYTNFLFKKVGKGRTQNRVKS